ncbi:CDK-activating kinase assembly factor MAT1 isoform X1 [Lampetra fluviatilis]
MDDQGCPRCKTTKYRNPQLKLMVNVCGHTLCESCVEMLFARGAGSCPDCATPLRKSAFRVQLFEDALVDKEVEIRKRVLKTYNKREEDFPSLREYNDYLEEIEDIVFNLTNNVDVETTKRRMEQYQRDNRDIIQKNRVKTSREQEELCVGLQWELDESERRRLELLQGEQQQRDARKRAAQALLDQMEASQLPARLLLAEHRERVAQGERELRRLHPPAPPSTTFSTGIKMKVLLEPVMCSQESLFSYRAVELTTWGPRAPTEEELGPAGYLSHVRSASSLDQGGGYSSALACRRALQDALSGLFWRPHAAAGGGVVAGGAAATGTT